MIQSKHRLTGKPWSRKYINKAVDRIRRMFRWGVENELVPPSVKQKLEAVAGLRKGRSKARETEARRPVPQEHIDAMPSSGACHP